MTDAAEPRVRLNRDRVLRVAVALADSGGIESLTMRKLGVELGVEAMSLYNHVANKADLLDGMIDVVFAGDRPSDRRFRLADSHAPAGDVRPRGARPAPVGHRPDGVADHPGPCHA